MDSVQVENDMVRGVIFDFYKKTLSELFYNTCTCIARDPEKDKMLNPVYHEAECSYRKHVEELELKFEDD